MLLALAAAGVGTAVQLAGRAPPATVLAHASASLAFALLGAMLGAGALGGHALAVLRELGPVELPCPSSFRARVFTGFAGIAAFALLLAGPAAYARFGAVPGEPALLVLAAGGLLAWMVAGWLAEPVRQLQQQAARLAAGDLREPPPSTTDDELGQLAGDVRRGALAQRDLARELREEGRGVGEAAREVAALGTQLRAGAGEARAQLGAVQAATEAMHGEVSQVNRGVEGLSEQLTSTAGAAAQVTRALVEVQRQAGELGRLGEAAGKDIERLTEVGQRAQRQLQALESLAGSSGKSLAGVSGSLDSLERSTVASQLAAAQAAELADHAGEVVREAAAGMDGVRAAVGDAQRRVVALGHRSDDIDQILTFINDVAGRTNLLSLNASIIATQAGEHGKAFAVVAEQIRELAAQISSSTRSIGQIIGAVRDDVQGTAALIDRGDALAAGGVALAQKSLGALEEIRTATGKGHETAAAIQESLAAHGAATREVGELVASVAHNSRALSEAVQVVGRSVESVRTITGGVQQLAGRVVAALEEHAELGRQQLGALDGVDVTLRALAGAMARHAQAEQDVRLALARLEEAVTRREAAAQTLEGFSDRLARRARALVERAERFRLE
jgi:methyl-accepting chemotaxis protein